MSKILKFPVSNMPQALTLEEVARNLFEADRTGKWKEILGSTIDKFIQNMKLSSLEVDFYHKAYKSEKMNNEFSDKRCCIISKPEGKLLQLTIK